MINISNSKRRIPQIMGVLIAMILSNQAQAEIKMLLLEDFSSYSENKTPSGGSWKGRDGDPNEVYKVLQTHEDGHFLRADDKGQSIQFFRKVDNWNIKKFPYLRWRWRPIKFPGGSNEVKGPNDSVLGVYVVFPNRYFIPEAIKYVWSESVEKGTVLSGRKRFPKVIARTGTSQLGKWVWEERNVYEDFKKLMGRRPGNPVAIGFLTDSNSVKKGATGDYDKFIISNTPKISVKSPKPAAK